jgi:hypothetical protein
MAWTSRPLENSGDVEARLQLTDGAVIDNNGILATIKGMQDKFEVHYCSFSTCTVLLLAEEDAISMGVLFGQNGAYWKGLFGQESQTYIKSHGTYDCPVEQRMLIGCEAKNACDQIVDDNTDPSLWICRIGTSRTDVDPIVKVYEANMETLEHKAARVKGGMKFKSIIIGYKYGMFNNILNFLSSQYKDMFVEEGRVPMLGPKMGEYIYPLWQRINQITRNSLVTELNNHNESLTPWTIPENPNSKCEATPVSTPVFEHCEGKQHIGIPWLGWLTPICK